MVMVMIMIAAFLLFRMYFGVRRAFILQPKSGNAIAYYTPK